MSGINTNKLANETSPYLKQHAHNPVNWYPWGKEALDKAKEEDKPILVSIGYSACHWCHVMERESFEHEEIAQVMNDNFICIKVDREERPDIDQIYMDAVHVMGLNGGWPLNVFTTPDLQPFYGGTYFPPHNWLQIIQGVAKAYDTNRSQIEESAKEFARELSRSETEKFGLTGSEAKVSIDTLFVIVDKLKTHFDKEEGGMDRAPKFPLPSVWHFLIYANNLVQKNGVGEQVELTLDKMALGGIYDHIGGGFARYSVDARWFAPHFEKMLYDNGQLLSLYSEAYRVNPKQLYKNVVYKTIEWLKNDMMSEEGGFYAALDADSEGVEGKYYTWTSGELREILGDDYPLFYEYFNIREDGNWEENRNILYCKESPSQYARDKELEHDAFEKKLSRWVDKLKKVRDKRIRPGLDDKILAGWNGITLRGLTDAYRVFDDEDILSLALKNAEYIVKELIKGNKLYRLKNDRRTIEGTLEDYAFVIYGLIGLYEVTFDEKWLAHARELADTTLAEFYDDDEGLFFYTSANTSFTIARKKELFDNVIPASNSQMAINLYLLSKFYYNDYYKYAINMYNKMEHLVKAEPGFLTNWAKLAFYIAHPTAEVAMIGKDKHTFRKDFEKYFVPNKIIAGGGGDVPIVQNRTLVNEKTTIYVCYDKTCKLPVHSVKDAVKQLNIESSVT